MKRMWVKQIIIQTMEDMRVTPETKYLNVVYADVEIEVKASIEKHRVVRTAT